MMPEMNGYEMTERLKSMDLTCHIPIIMLTAKASQESKIGGLQKGADYYISKPFHQEELLLNIKNGLTLTENLRKNYLSKSNNDEEVFKDPFIEKAKNLIIDNLEDQSINVQLLSQQLYLSRSQVYRKIKALTGQNIQRFILSTKLEKSIDLLKNSTSSISDISYQCGFTDSSHFSNAFLEEYGVRPSAHRTDSA